MVSFTFAMFMQSDGVSRGINLHPAGHPDDLPSVCGDLARHSALDPQIPVQGKGQGEGGNSSKD